MGPQRVKTLLKHLSAHTPLHVSPKFLGFVLFFYVIVSQVWPQRATWERLRKTSLLSSQVPELDAEHTMSCRQMEKPQSGQQAESGNAGKAEARIFIGVSVGQARQGKMKFRTG